MWTVCCLICLSSREVICVREVFSVEQIVFISNTAAKVIYIKSDRVPPPPKKKSHINFAKYKKEFTEWKEHVIGQV